MNQSIRAAYDEDIKSINQDLKTMGEMVIKAIENSMESLKNRDLVEAAKVIADDNRINELRFRIEEACLTLIATQQPIASDLRTIIAILHCVLELERMGDHASGIARIVIKASDEKPLKPRKKIKRMAKYSINMIGEWLIAFENRDGDGAKAIAQMDSEMDRMYKSLFDQLIRKMSEKPKFVPRATYIMWCGHNLERIADRVTNLAEQVIFMTTGSMEELGK